MEPLFELCGFHPACRPGRAPGRHWPPSFNCKGGARKPFLSVADEFALYAGRMYAIVGKSGAGKTVFNSLLVGHPAFSMSATPSRCRFFGKAVDPGAFARRTRMEREWGAVRKRGVILYLPQQLPDGRGFDMSVREYYVEVSMALAAQCRVTTSGKDILQVFDSSCDSYLRIAAPLKGKLDLPLGLLSGGERRRIELLARIQALNGLPDGVPALVILDEPTTGLDPSETAKYFQVLRDSVAADGKKAIATLVSTHSLQSLGPESVFDDVILIGKHHIGECGDSACRVAAPIPLKNLLAKWMGAKYGNPAGKWAAFLEEQHGLNDAAFQLERDKYLGARA